jgi:NodT family efflux transporter outer membrane factor (OMF) lipoprotein
MLLIGLGGCATVPNLGPMPEPAQSGALAAARSLAGTPQEWPRDNWWQGFGDPQLDTLVGEALKDSPTIPQAAARIRVAMAQADLARAARLPNAGVRATARESRITQSIGLPTDGEWHLLVAGLANVSYDLDVWGENRLALRAAVSAAQASEADDAAARLALVAAVATTYVDFAQWLVRRDVAADAERIRGDMRDLVARRFSAGLEPQASVEQAEGGVETARAELAAIDEAIDLTRIALAALLGAGPDRGLQIAAPSLRNRRPADLPGDIPIELVGRKPEVWSARLRVEAAAARIGVARAGFYPNVNLSALIGLASFGLNNLVDSRSVIGSAGPAISLPIFDGGRRSTNYTRARGEYDGAVAGYDAALLQALREAADAATSLRAVGLRMGRIDAALARQESAYRLSRIRYEGGLSDYQAVLISENALLAAREQAASIRLRGFLLDIALARSLGGGFRAPSPTGKRNLQTGTQP